MNSEENEKQGSLRLIGKTLCKDICAAARDVSSERKMKGAGEWHW